MTNSRLTRYSIASTSALASFPLSFFTLRWLLIRFHEWRIGHRLKFVFAEESDAALLALIIAVTVFFVVVFAFGRRSPSRK